MGGDNIKRGFEFRYKQVEFKYSLNNTCELMIHESLLYISKVKQSLNVQANSIPFNLVWLFAVTSKSV